MEKKKILIVEDDKLFREAIVDILKEQYDVSEAVDGKTAVENLKINNYDLVLSDIQMPVMTGLELLEWTKANKPVPIVIMTGFSTILETQRAFDRGAAGFISKPFKNAELLSVINTVFNESIDGANKTKLEFCKVSIDEFVTRPKIDFDLYIMLSETKSVKLANKGDEIPIDRVQHYKDKGIKHLHILKEDFSKLVEFNMNVTKIIKDRKDISVEKKLNFVKYTSEVLMEKVFVVGIDKHSFKEAQTFLDMSLEVIGDSNEHLNLLLLLNNHSDYVYAHSLGVALYSVMVAKKMFFQSNLLIFKLMTAGLYHDIGKKEIDKEILFKPRHLLTKEERRLFESHVVRGQDILMKISGVSDDIAHIVSEHHEDVSGQGYPFNKIRKEMHPLSKILQAVNIFMELILVPEGKAMSGAHAVIFMEKTYANRIDKEVLKAFKDILEK